MSRIRQHNCIGGTGSNWRLPPACGLIRLGRRLSDLQFKTRRICVLVLVLLFSGGRSISKEFTSPAARLTQQLELSSGGWWFGRSAPQITNSYNRNQRSDLRSDRDSNAGQAR